MAKKEEVKEKEIVEEKAENIVNNAANDSETPNDNGTTKEEIVVPETATTLEGRIKASPLARRVAEEKNVDLGNIRNNFV